MEHAPISYSRSVCKIVPEIFWKWYEKELI
jgi:hypothetical protein